MDNNVPEGDKRALSVSSSGQQAELGDVFTLALDKKDSVNSDERANQEATFELRGLLLQYKGTEELAWIPQALEAFIRSQRSDFLPNFGLIRGLHVDRKQQTIRLIAEGDDVTGWSVTFAELYPFALELQLKEIEDVSALEPIPYSSEMQEAISRLSPSAKYRWDLIARASRCIAEGKNRIGEGVLTVSVVGQDMLSSPEGVGVFLKRGYRSDLFSTVKVVGSDVPLTEQEQKILRMMQNSTTLKYISPEMTEFVSGLEDAVHATTAQFPGIAELSYVRSKSPLHRLVKSARRSLIRMLGKDSDKKRALDIATANSAVYEYDTGAERAGLMEFYRAKASYRDHYPFEYTQDDWGEGMERARNAHEKSKRILVTLAGTVQQNRELIEKCLPKEETRFWNQERNDRALLSAEGRIPLLNKE